MTDLARAFDEHRPTSLIGMPVGFAAEFVRKRLVEWREQGGDRLQAARKRARRHSEPLMGEILQ